VAAWATVSRLGLVKPWLLPSPLEVAHSIADGLRDRLGPRLCLFGDHACMQLGSLSGAVLVSLKRLLIGYGISAFFGVLLGLLLSRSELLRESLGTLVVALQALPSICWLPLAVLWFGLSEIAIQFVVIAGSLLSITVAAESGMRHVPPLLVRAARTMGARGPTLYLRVIIPAALPAILTGMRLGWTFAWRSLLAGELIYLSGGVGQLLKIGEDTNDMARVIAVMMVIIALGLLIELLVFARVEKRVRERWGYERS
jgi:NitT/TauT family transport system permease protein